MVTECSLLHMSGVCPGILWLQMCWGCRWTPERYFVHAFHLSGGVSGLGLHHCKASERPGWQSGSKTGPNLPQRGIASDNSRRGNWFRYRGFFGTMSSGK
jgi:hypothetical protein